MRPPSSFPTIRLAALAGLGGCLLAGLAACITPSPAGSGDPPPVVPAVTPTAGGSPAGGSPATTLPPLPSAAAPATPGDGFPEDRAVDCGNRPGDDALLALLHREDLLADDVAATVAEGPLCAGTWQYAVISVPDLDPLQVVTRGEPDALELVTAGTEVCTVDVRVRAPSGIRAAADCVS